MEAGRAIAGGYVTPRPHHDHRLDQPLLSDRRENGDGRRPLRSAETRCSGREEFAKRRCCSISKRSRKQSGAMINAVMLGVIAGAGALPIPAEAFEAAIRADGKAVDTNLRGFRAGFDAARAARSRVAIRASGIVRPTPRSPISNSEIAAHAGSGARIHDRRRAPARVLSGSCLCAALSRSPRADPRRRCEGQGDGRLLAETARHLARADVLRGRDPRRAGQDRSGAVLAHHRAVRRESRISRSR